MEINIQEEYKIKPKFRKALLFIGIFFSLLYVPTLIPGGYSWNSFSSATQSVSELFAFDAPSAPFVFSYPASLPYERFRHHRESANAISRDL